MLRLVSFHECASSAFIVMCGVNTPTCCTEIIKGSQFFIFPHNLKWRKHLMMVKSLNFTRQLLFLGFTRFSLWTTQTLPFRSKFFLFWRCFVSCHYSLTFCYSYLFGFAHKFSFSLCWRDCRIVVQQVFEFLELVRCSALSWRLTPWRTQFHSFCIYPENASTPCFLSLNNIPTI